jgi:hypothetical protein
LAFPAGFKKVQTCLKIAEGVFSQPFPCLVRVVQDNLAAVIADTNLHGLGAWGGGQGICLPIQALVPVKQGGVQSPFGLDDSIDRGPKGVVVLKVRMADVGAQVEAGLRGLTVTE